MRAADGPEDELDRIERRLRAELRAEAEAYEQLAAVDLLRGRRLVDVARDAMARGDALAVTAAGRTWTGTVIHGAGDLLCLRTPAGDVDVWLAAPLALRVVVGGGEGRPPAGEPGSFTARLFEHEAAGTLLDLGVTSLPDGLVGRLVAVALDHVVVDDRSGARWCVARSDLVWVAPLRAEGGRW